VAKNADALIAAMRKRVTIQNSTTLSDGQGGFTETWVDGAVVWASLEPAKGYERFQAMQMQTPITHKIVMRYRTDVTTATRLKYENRIFWIQECLNVEERKRFLQITAVERA
jgi:SPP1 family predicted phage head-tail adaptor